MALRAGRGRHASKKSRVMQFVHSLGGDFFGSANVHGTSLNTGDIHRLKAAGEVGQLIAGIQAGLSIEEIARAREWTDKQRKDVLAAAREMVNKENP